MQEQYDSIWINATLVMCDDNFTIQKSSCLFVKDGKIADLSSMHNFNKHEFKAKQIIDVRNKCITPGLIDCHTHVVYAGSRANEFEARLKGKTYAEIAKSGGGIKSTVKATRLINEEALFNASKKRILSLMQSGVTTLEIKSGYGLDLATEIKILKVIKKLREELPVDIEATFLGAHTVPPEFEGRADNYIDHVCHEMLPLLVQEKLIDAVDIFTESIAFNISQTKKMFEAAKKYNLKIKCHAEQLSNTGAAVLASQYDAISIDHLEYLPEEDVTKLKNTTFPVAVLLPGAFYFLKEKQKPPVEALRNANIPIAIATDCNPGTSPVTSLLLMTNMACQFFGLTIEETLLSVSNHAAQALQLLETRGTLTVNKLADFIVWDVSEPAELVYNVGNHPLCIYVKRGEIINLNKLKHSSDDLVFYPVDLEK